MLTLGKKFRFFKASLPALICFCALPAQALAAPKVGETVADFKVASQGGAEVAFSSLKKKVVILDFWASWCAPCMAELPTIGALWSSYHDKGLEVLAVNEDDDSKAGIAAAQKKISVPFPLYTDPAQALSRRFDVNSFPLTVVLDQKGKILMIENKERDWNSAETRHLMEGWLH